MRAEDKKDTQQHEHSPPTKRATVQAALKNVF